jgi:chromosome segregation ATPase
MDSDTEKLHNLSLAISHLEHQNQGQFESLKDLKDSGREFNTKIRFLENSITTLEHNIFLNKDKIQELATLVQSIITIQQDHTHKVLELQTIYKTIKTFGYLIISLLGLWLTLGSIFKFFK